MSEVALDRTDPWLCADFEVQSGSFTLHCTFEAAAPVLGVFGPSGAGKTTLLETVAGLRRVRRGRVCILGDIVDDPQAGVFAAAEKRRIGCVFQDHRLFPHLTVERNLLYGSRRPRRERRRHLAEIAALLEIDSLLGRDPATLSGGESQRVALGRALLSEPRILLCDEPLASLDPGLRSQILPYLRRAVAEFHVPLIYVSHALGEILELTTRVLILDRGRQVACGEVFEILGDEAVFRLASSLGLDNALAVQVEKSDAAERVTFAQLSGQTVTLPYRDTPPATRAIVHVRPEDVILSRKAVSGLSAQNALTGRVERVTDVRDRKLVQVDVGQPLRVEITHRAARDLGIQPGAAVVCLVKTYSFRWGSLLDGVPDTHTRAR